MNSPDFNQLIKEFMYFPTSYMDQSWLEGLLSEELFAVLCSNPRVKGRLNTYVIEGLGLGEVAHPTGFGWEAKLCLLPGDQLLSVFRRLMLVQHSAGLSQLISGNRIRHLKGVLSEDDFSFLMQSAPLMIPPERARSLPADEGITEDTMISHGISMLTEVWRNLPDVMVNRLKVKLPKRYDAGFSASASIDPDLNVKHVLLRIIRETTPPWRIIFD